MRVAIVMRAAQFGLSDVKSAHGRRERCNMNAVRRRAGSAGLAAAIAALTLLVAPALADADGGEEDQGGARPTYNFNATLHPPGGANADDHDEDTEGRGPSGLVKFRQPKDEDVIVYLDVRVRRLAASSTFTVQRATDTQVDDVCTGTNWEMPTLGQIATNETGRGRADLVRPLPPTLLGTTFDIHFRVIDAAGNVVLESACHQFTVRQ
jgi:hypothetical protein